MPRDDNCEQIFQQKSGRLEIKAITFFLGSDLQVLLLGGGAHIGAIALASPNGHSDMLELPCHKEGPISLRMAQELSRRLCRNVAVTSGIHFDDIEKEEIEEILSLTEKICREIISAYS